MWWPLPLVAVCQLPTSPVAVLRAGAGQSVETCEVTSDQACTNPGPPRPQGVRRGAGGLRSPGQVVARVWRLAWTRPVLPGLSSPRLVPVAGGQASTGHCATAPPPLTYIFTFLGHKTTWQLAAGQDRQ